MKRMLKDAAERQLPAVSEAAPWVVVASRAEGPWAAAVDREVGCPAGRISIPGGPSSWDREPLYSFQRISFPVEFVVDSCRVVHVSSVKVHLADFRNGPPKTGRPAMGVL